MDLLDGVIKGYAWGDPSYLAALQGRTPSGRPEAELWLGTHRAGPSRLSTAGGTLDEIVAADPSGTLGPAAARFDDLPFLAKILAAERPLSIQTHPSATQAAIGYRRECAAGIPVDAPDRVYRDERAKPEIVCALSRFEAFCGFRPVVESRARFALLGVPELVARLDPAFEDERALSDLVEWLFGLPEEPAAALVDAIADAANRLATGADADPALRWVDELRRLHPGDVGVVVAMLLHHVVLQPGEALFLEAGVLHSYLRGAAVELMGNSDNVVRGGLTEKHVDVAELGRIARFAPTPLRLQRPGGPVHTYDTPVDEISLTRVVLGDPGRSGCGDAYRCRLDGPEIVVVASGRISFVAGGDRVGAGAGDAVWFPASDRSYVAEGEGTFFRCGVGAAS